MESLFKSIMVYNNVLEYCELNGECRELEPLIATHAMYSFHYARYVIGGRFELGEKAIATDALCSYLYAKNIISGRFELGEEAIASDGASDGVFRKKYQEFLDSL